MDHSRRRGRETLGWRRVALAIAPMILVTAGAAELKAAAIRSDLEMARRDMGALHESAAQGRIDEATVLARRTSAATDAAARAARSPLVGVLTSIPLLGRQASTVRAMTASAAEASKAVTRLVEALAAAPALRGIDALELSGMNVSPLVRQVSPALPMLREAQAHITRARALLEAAAETGLVAALKHARREFAGELDAAERHIDMAIGLIDLGRRMSTGRPLRLLLLSQDTWELRPTGGFIGSYGILEVRDGRIELLRYDDATIIRRPYPVYRGPEPLASALGERPFDLRQAGWWPDFPTSASAAVDLLERSGGEPVDGVVAITQTFLEDVLRGIGGTVTVPGYDDVLTPENIADRILYHVELKKPLDVPRKRFLTSLTHEMFERLANVDASRSQRVAQALGEALRAKHAQVWLADERLHAPLALAGWDGGMRRIPRADFFSIADANMSAGKANRWVRKDIDYRVFWHEGRATAEVQIVTHNYGPPSAINPYYFHHVRVYAPTLTEHAPASAAERYRTAVASENGFVTFSTSEKTLPGERTVLTYRYRLPPGLVSGEGYRLLVRPQAGTPNDTYTIRIELGASPIVVRMTGDDGDRLIETDACIERARRDLVSRIEAAFRALLDPGRPACA